MKFLALVVFVAFLASATMVDGTDWLARGDAGEFPTLSPATRTR
jgi:hypothetical protein